MRNPAGTGYCAGATAPYDVVIERPMRGARKWSLNAIICSVVPASGGARRLATRMDGVFEEVLQTTPELEVVAGVLMLAAGRFRSIVLRKCADFVTAVRSRSLRVFW